VKLLANQQTNAFFPQQALITSNNNAFNVNKGLTKSDQAALVQAIKEQQKTAPQVFDSVYRAEKQRDKGVFEIPKKGGTIDLLKPPLKVLPPSYMPPPKGLPPSFQPIPIPIKPKPGIPDLRPPALHPEYKKLYNKLRDKERELARKRQEYDKLKKECDKLRDKNIFGDSSSIVNKIGKTHERFVRQFNFIDIDDLGHGSRLDMGIGEKTSKALALGVGLVALLGVIGRIE